MSLCVPATLGGIAFDDTVDADGNLWSWLTIEGWESAGIELTTINRAGVSGSIVAQGLRRGRSIVLAGTVMTFDATGYFKAIDRLADATDFVETAFGTLTVLEPTIPKQATVKLADRLKVGNRGALAQMEFQVPLLAPDYRKYGTALHSSILGAGGNVTNGGNARSPAVITIVGAAADVTITNASDGGRQLILGALGGGDTMVVDLAEHSVTVNGVSAPDRVAVGSRWFELVPGVNALTVATGSMTVSWRDAYR